MVNTHSHSHTSSRLNVSGSVKSVITYFSWDVAGGDDTVSMRLKYMALDHRALPLVNSVTSIVAGGGWWRKRKGRLIYVVVAGRGFELGS
jgi:hypothetical protein